MTELQSGSSKAAQLRAVLIKQDSRSMRGSLGRFLLGLGWCVLAVFAAATVVAVVLNAVFGGSGIGWRGWFTVFFLGMAGLLFWLQRRARTTDAAVASGAGDAVAVSRVEQALLPPPGASVSRLVWGPPALLAGFRGVVGARTRKEEAVFDRAVVLVFDLAREPGSIAVKGVLHPPEDLTVFGAAVDWLEANDWIGQSTDGSSVFISTLGQQRLVERKLTA
jgi:hypothetical protein